jgi:hypothetical protein
LKPMTAKQMATAINTIANSENVFISLIVKGFYKNTIDQKDRLYSHSSG